MLQPFEKFTARHLKQIISLGNIYVVSQTYKQADHFMDEGKIHLILSDYNDLGLAKIHHKAVRQDRYGAIIFLNKPTHLARIEKMLSENEYDIYWSVVESRKALEKKLNASYKAKIRRYLMAKTSWRLGRDEEVATSFQVIYGELWISLRWRTHKREAKFAEIEEY